VDIAMAVSESASIKDETEWYRGRITTPFVSSMLQAERRRAFSFLSMVLKGGKSYG